MQELKLRAGNYFIKNCFTWLEGGERYFRFPYNKILVTEVKSMRGARWVPEKKVWRVEDCQRNDFQLAYMTYDERNPATHNPYAPYESPLQPISIEPRFNKSKGQKFEPYRHQPMMTAHMVQRPGCIVAGEMGTTKTFCCMTALEIKAGQFLHKHGFQPEIWYVAPRSALRAVQREFVIWGTALSPEFMTYEGMVKKVKYWVSGEKPPPYIVFDESSKLKTHTSQRAQAAQYLADAARREWAEDAKIILMTGTPAPKDPGDWWSQCEIACPGFLKEGDIHKFKNRLGIIIKKERFDGGGMYPSLVTWRNDSKKCNVCGQYADAQVHSDDITTGLVGDDPELAHKYVPSTNEVEYLYKRMQGLVVVYFKKDCLDLPDKEYRPIYVEPTASTLRAAKLVTKAAKTVIEGLTRLRELSDGFQYINEKNGKKDCERCEGKKEVLLEQEIPGTCPNCPVVNGQKDSSVCGEHIPQIDRSFVPCPNCKGTGEEDRIIRVTKEVPCPKEQALIDLLDEYEDVGRVVIYAGFTAAIDRCVRVCQKQGWHVIRIDQGKELIIDDQGRHMATKDYLTMFQDQKEEYPRVAFVAHPGSAGMGLTLTASPVIIYYSNDFNGEYRTQSEDRIHRPGMDLNLGATIIDILHLPSDQRVLDNLKQKRNLELMSLGELSEVLQEGEGHERNTV
jgi:hypothetical protein